MTKHGRTLNPYGRIIVWLNICGNKSVEERVVNSSIKIKSALFSLVGSCNESQIEAPITAMIYVEDSEEVLNNTTHNKAEAKK